MPFSVQVHVQQGVTVVELSGELDVELAADLRTFFETLVEDRHDDVLVDVRMLTFCDSVGLSALIHGFHACRASGGSFRVTGETGLVRRLLHVTGVHGILSGRGEEPGGPGTIGRGPSGLPGRRPRGWHWASDHWASDAAGSGPESCDSAGAASEEDRGGFPAPHG
jgi:anti-sigma B factor antagonist